ncbi:MAG: hypothetical protein IJM62_05930 [Lachnospiraceae bacterium]|nr:hypothetical protein [Lachnospiraceae bacterium]
MDNENKEEFFEEEKKELNPEELEKVAGGDWEDDVACFFGSHKWSVLQMVRATNLPIAYLQQKCSNCGKMRYIVKNTETGDYKTLMKKHSTMQAKRSV